MAFIVQEQDKSHNPSEGVWGDCHRTACAMVLGVDKHLIPNFYNATQHDHHAANRLYDDFFASKGIAQIQIAIPGDYDIEVILDARQAQSPDTPYVLGVGGSQGVGHSIAIKDGKIFDPMGPTAKKYKASPDGFYWITYFGALDPSTLFTSRIPTDKEGV